MSLLTGLFDRKLSPQDVEKTLSDMTREASAHSTMPFNPGQVSSGQVALCATQNSNLTYSDESLLTAVKGSPRWLKQELQNLQDDKGPAFALAEAYRNLGKACLEQLHGDFAVAIAEPQKSKIIIAVDRLGIRPLAYSALSDGLIFASRADVLNIHPEKNGNLDTQGLFSYFYFEMVPSPITIYADVEKLLPAQILTWEQGQITKEFYWQPTFSETAGNESELSDRLHQLLRESVQTHLDESQVGAFLSGGLDSSTVAGYLARLSAETADVYGIGFDAEGYDEMEYARASAKHFGLKLHEYYVTPKDVAEALPRISSTYDEPFGNASAIPAYYCARMAKEDGKTRLLAGDGGDELFAGNARYAKQKIFALYDRVPAAIRSAILEPLLIDTAAGRLPLARKAASYIRQAKIPMPERMETYNFLHRTPLSDIFNADFLVQVDADAPTAHQKEVYEQANTDQMLKRMLFMDWKITLADNDIRKVSRTCELAGIDVRYPMMDDRLVDFAASVPCDMLLKRFELRTFYRNSMRDFLPTETLSKSKHGFGLPFGAWMEHDKGLKDLASDNLLRFRERGYLLSSYIDKLIDAHRSEHADYYGVMIWRIMMLEQWLHSHGK